VNHPPRRKVRSIVEEVREAPKARSVGALGSRSWRGPVSPRPRDVIVHVFDDEARAYYSLERRWADAARGEWDAGRPARDAGEAARS